MNRLTPSEKNELDIISNDVIKQLQNDSRELKKMAVIASSAAASVTSRVDAMSKQKFLKRLWNNITGKNRKLQNQINYDNSKALYLSQQILIKLANQQTMNLGIIRNVNLKLNNAVLEINLELNNIYSEINNIYTLLAEKVMSDISDIKQDIRLLQWVNAVDVCDDFQHMNMSEILFKIASDFYEIKGNKYENIDLLQMKKALKSAGINNSTITYRRFISDMKNTVSSWDKFTLNEYTDCLMTPVSLGLKNGADSVYDVTMIDVDVENDVFDFAAMLLIELDEIKHSEKTRNLAQAIPGMIKAAQNGDVNAQYYIGRLYIEGNIVERNVEKGLQCLIAATKNGSSEAKKYMEGIKNG